MTVCTDMTPVGVILFSTAGSLAGAVILYSVGRFLPDEVFRKLLCGQIGHLLHFGMEGCGSRERMVQGTREIGGVPVQADPHRPQPDLHPCRDCQDAVCAVSCLYGGGKYSVEHGPRLCREDRWGLLGEGVGGLWSVFGSVSHDSWDLHCLCCPVSRVRRKKKAVEAI